MGRDGCFVMRFLSLHDFHNLSSICIASLISMPRFKLALTSEEKGNAVSIGGVLLQRRPINRLDHHGAANGLTPGNSKAKCDQRRYSRLSFQLTPKRRPRVSRP